MQSNGADQGQDSGLSCQNNNAQNRENLENLENGENGECSSGRGETAHSNGLLSGPGTGNSAAQTGTSPLSSSGSGSGSLKKQKRLSQSEEDVIRLIGQHLHGLGLKTHDIGVKSTSTVRRCVIRIAGEPSRSW
ncbi:hypothetical protein PGIGA_G00194370, partial [Pangasianodon gigas]|nr:hypothetical protein [Pangasianodon gigas]